MPRRLTAIYAIAALTVLVSLAVIFAGDINYAAEVAGFIPGRVAGTVAHGIALSVGYYPLWITPLSATLLHAGLMHLVLNMAVLVYTGAATERALGASGVAILYLVGAYAAAAAQWLSDPGSPVPMVGASGALSAVVGAYSLLFGRSRARPIGPVPARVVTVVWLAAAWTLLNLAIGVLSRGSAMPIAAAAHVGGFIAGLALAYPLLRLRWRAA